MPDADPRARQMIARAWKDEEYRSSLPPDVREKLPAPPDGASTMTDDQLEAAAGGTTPGCAAVTAFAAGVMIENAWDD
jgi:mersacidin/lichenicidin family type 2 lantibiotic